MCLAMVECRKRSGTPHTRLRAAGRDSALAFCHAGGSGALRVAEIALFAVPGARHYDSAHKVPREWMARAQQQ
jgi:hypothetical protein